MLTASCNGSFMQKFYQNPSAHSVINRSPYQPYSAASNLNNLNSLATANGSNPLSSLNGFNNGLNSVTSISSSPSSLNTSTPRYSTTNVGNNAYNHMQAVAAAASQQFNIGSSNGSLHQTNTTSNTDDWYSKSGFTSSALRMNPLQYQA